MQIRCFGGFAILEILAHSPVGLPYSADLIFTPQNLNLSLTEPYLAGDHHLYNSTIDYADPLTYKDTRIIYNITSSIRGV
jgi:hypothetical protein